MTDKRAAFCKEYVVDWNGKQAAIRAGYPEKRAAEQAYEILRHPEVREWLSEYKEHLEENLGISKQRMVEELMKVAFSNMGRYKDGWMTMKEFNGLTDSEKACISEVKYEIREFEKGSSEIVTFKLHDKLKASDMINKMMGYNATTKLDVTSDGERLASTIVVQDVEPD